MIINLKAVLRTILKELMTMNLEEVMAIGLKKVLVINLKEILIIISIRQKKNYQMYCLQQICNTLESQYLFDEDACKTVF